MARWGTSAGLLLLCGALTPLITARAQEFPAANPDPAQVPSGNYRLDQGHGKITWFANHHGLSTFIGQFAKVDATLKLDSANPAASALDVTVDINSIATLSDRFDERLKSAQWFDVADYPTAHFVSTKVERTGDRTAVVTGNLTLHGVTKPVQINVTFNGAMSAPRAVVGFDGTTTINRTDFGMSTEFPSVAGQVKLMIEGEFSPD